MTTHRAAAILFGLPLVWGLAVAPALAEDGATSVAKKTPSAGAIAPEGLSEPQDALRPSLGDETTGAIDPDDELPSSAVDEGAAWEAVVQANSAPTPLIGDKQAQAVQRINAYFNGITNLQGRFEQVDPSNKRSNGRFYVQRPGKIRFDYAPPSALRIVADGSFLAIEDSSLKTVEKYPIKSTPFRLLLAATVDLGRDARIVGVESQQGSLAISLEDKSGDAAGRIKLVFDANPDLTLKQWQIIDAQGLTTSVSVTDVVSGRQVATDFFNSTTSFQPFR
jgi:outer membrane lipoprotein-sorting protein